MLLGRWILSPDQQVSATEDLFTPTYPVSGGSIALTVRVAPSNRAPTLAVYIPLGAETVAEGGYLEYWLTAVDPDETVPLLSAIDLPDNASIIDSGNGAGALIFDPGFDQAGDYPVMVIASDGVLSDSVGLLLSVIETNRLSVSLDSMSAAWSAAWMSSFTDSLTSALPDPLGNPSVPENPATRT